MKTKWIIILLILCGMVILISGYNDLIKLVKHPESFDSKDWQIIQLADINYICLSPLLSHHGIRNLTVKNHLFINKKEIIEKIWLEMKGRESARKLAGKWFDREQLKITFYMVSGKKIAFRMSFHVHRNVVEFYQLNNPNERYFIGGTSDRGSAKLYGLLKEQINKSDTKWVLSNKDCWEILKKPKYKGCPYYEKKRAWEK